jgi:hypothetical protein
VNAGYSPAPSGKVRCTAKPHRYRAFEEIASAR